MCVGEPPYREVVPEPLFVACETAVEIEPGVVGRHPLPAQGVAEARDGDLRVAAQLRKI